MAKNKQETLDGIQSLIDEADQYLSTARIKWGVIHDQVFNGTPSNDLEDWQAKFNLPVLLNAVLGAKTELVETLINRPDWYDLDELDKYDLQARDLKTPLKKMLDYYLRAANWSTVAGDAILMSLISVSNVAVLWQERRISNPAWIEWKNRQKNATHEETIEAYNTMDPDQLAQDIQGMSDLFAAVLEGQDMLPDTEPSREIVVGGLKFDVPNFKSVWWEPTAPSINESPWMAYEFTITDYQLRQWADAKVFSKKATDELLQRKPGNTLDIVAYFGPQIVMEGSTRRIKSQSYFCYYSGDVVLASGPYPYLEVREQNHPLVNGVARRIPYVNYGMSPSEFSVDMQRWLDHNWRLLTDQMRYGVLGFNILNHGSLINQDVLDQGLEPGTTLRVTGKPSDVFQHVDLTNNRENQSHPVNELLRTGVTEGVGTGGPGFAAVNLRSRTTSREIDALQQRSERSLIAIANELTTSFIMPALEKAFARVIQFGLSEVETNPELSALLNEEEKRLIASLSKDERMSILRTFYRFKLRGYKARDEDAAIIQSLNALLQAVGSNQQLAAKINYDALLTEYTERLDLADKSLVLTDPTEYDTIAYEKSLLAQNRPVAIGPNDNHELHLQMQAPGPNATEAEVQHYQQHQQLFQQSQQMNKQNMV